MNRTLTLSAASLVMLAAAACGAADRGPRGSDASSPAAPVAAQDAQSKRATAAARAFLATLGEAQRKAIVFPFDDSAQRRRWTNFPDPAVTRRSGLRWGDLAANQRAALRAMLASILSPYGTNMVYEQMEADEVNRTMPYNLGGPPPGRPRVNFGRDFYFVSFVGAPSETSPWMLQFGGHHLAINATVVGPRITLSPSLTGGEPLKFDLDGKRVYVVEREVRRADALLASLSAEQRASAVLSTERADLVLGPGHDGQVLQPQGIQGSDLTAAQRKLLIDLVESRVGILNDDDAAKTMATIRSAIDRTWFGWWGPTTPIGAAYFRVTAPSLILEFSPQDNDGDASDHAHNMYRDPTNEYGAAWARLK